MLIFLGLLIKSCYFIKKQLAYEYARKGAKLSLVDIKEESLVTVAEMARSLGSPDVINIGADVSVVQDSKRFVDETVDHFGQCMSFLSEFFFINFYLKINYKKILIWFYLLFGLIMT